MLLDDNNTRRGGKISERRRKEEQEDEEENWAKENVLDVLGAIGSLRHSMKYRQKHKGYEQQ